jgi:hypothetical protein
VAALTEKFYLTYSGACSQVRTHRGKMDEFPYDLNNITECKRKGPHPHGPSRSKKISKFHQRCMNIKPARVQR